MENKQMEMLKTCAPIQVDWLSLRVNGTNFDFNDGIYIFNAIGSVDFQQIFQMIRIFTTLECDSVESLLIRNWNPVK